MTDPLVAVFGSSATTPGSRDWVDAENAGRRLATNGFGVITGGYGGTMEAASRGAAEGNARVVGVIAPAVFPGRSGANRYVSEIIEAATIPTRIDTMLSMAAGCLALPGSIGTMTELLVTWNVNNVGRRHSTGALPCVAVGKVWKRVGTTLASEIGVDIDEIQWENDAAAGVDTLIGLIEKR